MKYGIFKRECLKDDNLKSPLTLGCITANSKRGLDAVCRYSVCAFMCLPLRLVSSGTPAAAAGSRSLGRRRSEQL